MITVSHRNALPQSCRVGARIIIAGAIFIMGAAAVHSSAQDDKIGKWGGVQNLQLNQNPPMVVVYDSDGIPAAPQSFNAPAQFQELGTRLSSRIRRTS